MYLTCFIIILLLLIYVGKNWLEVLRNKQETSPSRVIAAEVGHGFQEKPSIKTIALDAQAKIMAFCLLHDLKFMQLHDDFRIKPEPPGFLIQITDGVEATRYKIEIEELRRYADADLIMLMATKHWRQKGMAGLDAAAEAMAVARAVSDNKININEGRELLGLERI